MTQIELENAKLVQLASEYREKGYEVSLRPSAAETPAFLGPFQPDLIVTSANDKAVIEIKSSRDLASESLLKLAEAVEAEPGWRMELVVVNLPKAPELPDDPQFVTEERVDALLRDAKALRQEKRYEAAAMMAWSAAEATLRRIARASGIEAERKSSGTILKELYILGAIDADEYDSFTQVMEFRNAFAHGFAATFAPETLDRFLDEVAELKSRPAA